MSDDKKIMGWDYAMPNGDISMVTITAEHYHANQKLIAKQAERIATFKSEVEILDMMIKELRELINKQLDLHIEHCGIDARLQNVEGVNRTLKQLLTKE